MAKEVAAPTVCPLFLGFCVSRGGARVGSTTGDGIDDAGVGAGGSSGGNLVGSDIRRACCIRSWLPSSTQMYRCPMYLQWRPRDRRVVSASAKRTKPSPVRLPFSSTSMQMLALSSAWSDSPEKKSRISSRVTLQGSPHTWTTLSVASLAFAATGTSVAAAVTAGAVGKAGEGCLALSGSTAAIV